MAAKRVAKSSVDWARFAQCVPEGSEANFAALRAKVEGNARRVAATPASPPALDWAHYQAKVAKPGLAADFKKKYEALTIPYPKDPDNLTAAIDVEEKTALKDFETFKGFATEIIDCCKEQVSKWDNFVPFAECTVEEEYEQFPHFFPTEPRWWPDLKPEDLRPEDYEEVLALEADIKAMKLERKAKIKGLLGMN